MSEEEYLNRFRRIVYTWDKNYSDMLIVVDVMCKENNLNALIYLFNMFKDKYDNLTYNVLSKTILKNNFNIFKYFIENGEKLSNKDYENLYCQAEVFGGEEIRKYFKDNYMESIRQSYELFQNLPKSESEYRC